MTNKLTRRQAAIVSAYTGELAGPFSDLHALVEELLGRPVFTHEMGSEKTAQEIKNAAKPLFLSICVEDTTHE